MESQSGLTLTQLAYYGRLTVKFGSIALVALIVGRTFFNAFSAYWIATHPPAPPAPTQDFGALPPLHFPTQQASDKPSSYQLQTATGALPLFSDRAKVYFMPKASISLLADQKAKEVAAAYGFIFKPDDLSGSYRWTKTKPLQETLNVDLKTLNFSLTSDYLSHPELLSQKDLPDGADAVRLVKSYIGASKDLPGDIATSSGTVTYLKSSGTGVVPALSFSDADFIQVDLMRAPVDQKPLITPQGNRGIVHAIISGAFEGNDKIVEFDYKYHPIDYTEVGTYPLRSTLSAWQILQGGEGYIVNKGSGSGAVVVRDVSLAYYDDYDEQEYLQPVYVFTGDGGFMGLVPAISPTAIQQSSAPMQRPLQTPSGTPLLNQSAQ